MMTTAAVIPVAARTRLRGRRCTSQPTKTDSGRVAATIPITTHSVVVGSPSIWMLWAPVSRKMGIPQL